MHKVEKQSLRICNAERRRHGNSAFGLGALLVLGAIGGTLTGCGGGNTTAPITSGSGATPTPSPTTTPSPTSSTTPITPLTKITDEVLFVSERAADGSAALYAMKPDASNLQALAQIPVASGNGNGVGTPVQITRDGNHVLISASFFLNFTTSYTLYSLNGTSTSLGDSGGTQSDFNGAVAVNSDGSLITIGGAAYSNKTPGIYTVRPDRTGETLHCTLPGGASKVSAVAFSADDTQIYFAVPGATTGTSSLYRITLSESTPVHIADVAGSVIQIKVRADGGALALQARSTITQKEGSPYTVTVWTLNPDGTALAKGVVLNYSYSSYNGATVKSAALAFSADGTLRLLYAATSTDAAANDEIFSRLADGADQPVRLTFNAALDLTPLARADRKSAPVHVMGMTGR